MYVAGILATNTDMGTWSFLGCCSLSTKDALPNTKQGADPNRHNDTKPTATVTLAESSLPSALA